MTFLYQILHRISQRGYRQENDWDGLKFSESLGQYFKETEQFMLQAIRRSSAFSVVSEQVFVEKEVGVVPGLLQLLWFFSIETRLYVTLGFCRKCAEDFCDILPGNPIFLFVWIASTTPAISSFRNARVPNCKWSEK